MPCDIAVHAALPTPEPEPGRPIVVSGRTSSYGVELAGAKVVWLSSANMTTWAGILAHPEQTDDWLPASLGTKRVDRLDPGHIYQATDLVLLGGLIRVARQAVVAISWESTTSSKIANCWWVEDPKRWPALPFFADSSGAEAEFVLHGQGGWDLVPMRGGVSVSYAFWTEAKTMLPQVQAWAMSRTLPELSRAFEQRALLVEGTAGGQLGGTGVN